MSLSVQDYSIFIHTFKHDCNDTQASKHFLCLFMFLLSLGGVLNTQFRIAKKWVLCLKATLVSPVHFCLKVASV